MNSIWILRASAILVALFQYGGVPAQNSELSTIRSILASEPDREDYIREVDVLTGSALTCDIGTTDVAEWKFGPKIAAKKVLVSRGMTYRMILTGLRYPPTVISNAMTKYENNGIAIIKRDPKNVFNGSGEQIINSVINRYRTGTGSRLKKINFGDRECGGSSGLPRAVFIIRPVDTRAFIVPDFFAKLCKARAIDSFDMSHCAGWIELLDGSQLSVYGRYVYQLRSNAGRSRRGTLKLEATGPVRLTL